MSEQAKIIAELNELVMRILKSGSPTLKDGQELDRLEELLYEEKCYENIDHEEYAFQGEVVASIFFTEDKSKAIDKMIECRITPDDFFGFIEYHYDEDHSDEHLIGMFTDVFIADVNHIYQSKI